MFRPSLLRAGLLCGGLALAAGAPVRTVDDVALNPFRPGGAVGLLFFVLTDCPISNSYAPEIQRICDDVRKQGGSCTLVYEDSSIAAAAVRAHREDYRYRDIPAIIDHGHAIARRAKATITPQAVVVTPAGVIKYRGRIDDRYVALGQQRRVVTSHDLRDAIDAVIAGKPVPRAETEAVGCFIPFVDILEPHS